MQFLILSSSSPLLYSLGPKLKKKKKSRANCSGLAFFRILIPTGLPTGQPYVDNTSLIFFP